MPVAKPQTRGRFPREFYLFLIIQTSLTAFIAINGTFLNTFLYRATSDDRVVMLFNIVLAIVQPVTMLLAVVMVRKLSAIRSQQIGLLMFASVYVVLIFSSEDAVSYIYWLSGILSAANGFYYATYTLQIIAYTRDNSRDAAYGLMGVCGGAVSLAVPLLSGFLVSAFPDYTGYRLLFCVGLAFTALCLVVSTRLPYLELPDGKHTVQLRPVAKTLLTNRVAFATMWLSGFNGVRAGTLGFYLTILLYSAIAQESLIGLNSFLAGVAAIVSSMLYSKFVRPHIRGRAMLIALGLLLGATLLLFTGLSPWLIIAYTIFNSLVGSFIDTTPLVTYMAVLEKLPQLNGCGAEVHTIREYFYAIGRVIGVLFALLVPAGDVGAICVLIGLILLTAIGALLVSYVQKKVREMDAAALQ